MSSRDLVFRVREPQADPIGALILFHGRADDEDDLVGLLDELDPERRFLGVTPRAPIPLRDGKAYWWVVSETGALDAETVRSTLELTGRWLDGFLRERGIGMERTVLGGFSQGAAVALALTLLQGRPQPAAVLSFSGYIPRPEGVILDLDDRPTLKAAIGHGVRDENVSPDRGREARDLLEGAGAEVFYRESPMEHDIDSGFVADLRPWIVSAVHASE